MARSSWNIAVFGALVATGLAGGMGWVLWAQSPVSEAIAPPPLERHITVGLSGQKMRCKVLQSWNTPSGGQAYRVSVVESGENLTVVREGSGDGKEMPVRIFRWSDATTSPVGAPVPPAATAPEPERILNAGIQDKAKKASEAIAPPPATQVASAPRTIDLPPATPLVTPMIPESPAPVIAAAATPLIAHTVTPLPTITPAPLVAIAPKLPIIVENTTPIATVRPPIIINGTDEAPILPQRSPAPTLVAQNTPFNPPAVNVPTPTPPAAQPAIVELAPRINEVPPLPTPPTVVPEPVAAPTKRPTQPATSTFNTAMDPNGQAPWAKGEPMVIPGKSTLDVTTQTAPQPVPQPTLQPTQKPLPRETSPSQVVTAAAQPVPELPTPQVAPPQPPAPPSTSAPAILPPPASTQLPGREVIVIPASRSPHGGTTIAPPPATTPIIAPPPAMPTGPDLGVTTTVVKETIVEVSCDETGRLLQHTANKTAMPDLFGSKKTNRPGETTPCTTCPPGTHQNVSSAKGCPTGACELNGGPPLPSPPGCASGACTSGLCPPGAGAPPGACGGLVPVARVVGNKSSIYDRMKSMFSPHAQQPPAPAHGTLISTVPYGAVPNIPYESSARTYQPLPAGFDRTSVPGSTPNKVMSAGITSPPQPMPGAMDRTRVSPEPKTPSKTVASSNLPGLPPDFPVKKDKEKIFIVNETPLVNKSPKPAPYTGLDGRRGDDHPALPVVAEMPAAPPESPAAKANRIWQTGMVDPKLFSNGSKLAYPAPSPTSPSVHPSMAPTPTIAQIEPTPDRWKGLFYLKKDAPATPMAAAYPVGYPMNYPAAMPGAMMPMNAFHNMTPPQPFNAFPAPVVPVTYGYPSMPHTGAPAVMPVNYEQTAPGPVSAAPQGDRRLLLQLLQTAKESPHPSQREWAVMSLATYDVKSHPHLVAFLSGVALSDTAGAVRATAVTSLKRLGVPAQTIYITLQSLRNDTDVRVRSAVEEACEAR